MSAPLPARGDLVEIPLGLVSGSWLTVEVVVVRVHPRTGEAVVVGRPPGSLGVGTFRSAEWRLVRAA